MSDKDTSTTFETVTNTPQNSGLSFNTKSNSLKIKADKHSYISQFNNKLKKGKTQKNTRLFLILFIVIIIAVSIFFAIKFFNNHYVKVDDSTFVIEDNSYITSINKVYSNLDLFIGKNISLNGMLKTYIQDNKKYMMVYRNTPGDSGNNGIAGFDFEYPDMQELDENSWINVTGILTKYIDNENEYLKIEATSVTPLIDVNKDNEFVIK